METNKIMMCNEETKVCVMRGFYDAEGEYHEEYMEGIALSKLPEKAAVRVDLEYDITTLYSRCDVLVVARSSSEIAEYKKLEGTPRFFHGLLYKGEHNRYDGYTCMVSNLRTLRKWYKNRSKRLS